ncbi:hypothetical protein BDN70DRAFT_874835 [Pholiota conissans]|uniref:VPS9 domain-containing protein n=1 Tax=Pholiota conissans TaxID=109636 RepID=A0A9P6D4H6_9AGAR|nr:hypothetical protein BDN70DRAFT_874835 [Pholiota conissans]
MQSKRDGEFPVTSIGRSSGARLQASVAHEAHPLLSPGPSSPPTDQGAAGLNSGSGATLSTPGGPRYVPYTPRQRVSATAATTGTTVHPPSPQQHQGDATSKLQVMHLKAAAQSIGLDSGTLGWSILEKLVLEPEVSEEWIEVWSAITSGKATLLLPLESSSTQGKVTADFVKDHVILCDNPPRKDAPIITLSGLRGTLENETITFRSTVNPTSKIFQDILNPTTRSSSLLLLPPLPGPIPDITPSIYPQYNIPSYTSSLHLPPRNQAISKPPLPPRPVNRNAPTAQASTSRISLPFASLFGGGPTKNTPARPPSPPASLRSFDSAHDGTSPIEVPAFTIDRRIVRKDLAKEMNKAIRAEVKAAIAHVASLEGVPIPTWVTERIHDLTADWYPFVKNKALTLQRRLAGEKSGKDNGNGYIVSTFEESLGDTEERLQDFYLALEQDMRLGGTPFIPKTKERDPESDAEDENDREKRENDRMESETRIREVMEGVERMVTSIFYDRLFMQPTTDDASHDEALSSRVAALNMLDLGLGHLGIEVPDSVNEELNAVVNACGDMLTQLDNCYSPVDKSAILVAAHKIVVDGLSKLPPIRLISEDEASNNGAEDGLLTARPKPASTKETEKLTSELESITHEVRSEEAVYSTSPPSAVVSPVEAPEASQANTSASSSSSRVKSPPPPLLLDSPTHPPHPHPIPHIPHPDALSAPKEPTPVSGDVLLPLIIFSVVKTNPPHLVSNLLFTQRFRNQAIGGEENYCLINLLAVAEFLENVDMESLGLGDSDKVMSTADLTPITLTRSPITSETPLEPAEPGLRGRVGQQVDAITDSANKVITGVVDSSFGILRSFMPSNVTAAAGAVASAPTTPMLAAMRPGFGLLRRESGFSIASLAASLPITGRSRSNTAAEEAGQQLLTVSRPSSVRSRSSAKSLRIRTGDEESEDDDEESEAGEESDETNEEEDGEDGEEDEEDAGTAAVTDTRSIRSFESMLSASKPKSRSARARKSLSDRLASVSALAHMSSKGEPSSRRASLLQPGSLPVTRPGGSPTSSRAASPTPHSPPLRLAPPKQRFMHCAPDDLRMSEIGELLREYRRLVEGIRSVGGFEE